VIVLGLDVGDRRIGVAISDPTGLVVRPLNVLRRTSNLADGDAIARLVAENQVEQLVVGLPLAGDNSIGEQARKTLAFVRFLRKRLTIPIATWDERYSTQDAQREMIAQGRRRARRRELLDAAAAAVLLDEWLTAHRPAPTAPADPWYNQAPK
jgi:putative Holliday junction resolvase